MKQLNLFEKYLTLWVIGCIGLGISLGKLFPEVANTWDSLGEAYMQAGETTPALRIYRKALNLNPDNENAKNMIERLAQ